MSDNTEHHDPEDAMPDSTAIRGGVRLSEGFYRALFEATPDGIALFDDDGVYLAANPTLCRLLQCSEQQIVGSHFARFIQQEYRQRAIDRFATFTEDGHDYIDVPLVGLDGEPVELEWRVRVNIQPGVHLAVAREVGDLRRIQSALVHRMSELEALLEVLPVGVGIARDRECRRIDVNAQLAAMLGITRTTNASLSAPIEERPDSFICRIDGREVDASELPLQIAAASGVVVSDVEIEVVRSDGETLRLLEFAAPLFDESGEPRGSVGAIVDITERRRHELERTELLGREMEARDRAERAERRSTTLAEVSAMLASALDYQAALREIGKFLVPRIADWCAIDMLDEQGGVQLVAVTHVDPTKVRWAYEVRRRYPVRLDSPHGAGRVLRTGESEFVPYVSPEMIAAATSDPELLEIVRAIGFTSIIYVPLLAREKILGVLQLVTAESGRQFTREDVELAESIAARAAIAIDNLMLWRQAEQARTEAENASAAKDQFMAVLSHELRTPLTPVLAALGLLHEELHEQPHAVKLLRMMQRNIELEARLIDDLLDVTRITRGKLAIYPSPVDLHEILHNVHEIWAAEAAAAKITLELQPGATSTTVHADGSRLQQVFWNLIGNAIKFTPAGGHVAMMTGNDDHAVVVEIRDNGIGIGAGQLDAIFDPFVQAVRGRARRDGGGLGLGLAIARSIIDQHGGTIGAASDGEGEGAVFTVRLPLPL